MTDAAPRLLIAASQPHESQQLAALLSGLGYDVVVRPDGRAALAALAGECFDVALLDLSLAELDGLELLRQIQQDPAGAEVIMLAGPGSIEAAAAAVKLGAFGWLARPHDSPDLEILVRRACERHQLAREVRMLRRRLDRADAPRELLTGDAAMLSLLALAERVATSDTPVLIGGEPGSGRRLLAATIHRLSHRAAGALVEVDCAAVPDSAVEAELFGRAYAGGAAAGFDRIGALELASGGTLLVTRVDSLPARLQSRLLHTLEQRSFTAAGAARTLPARQRIIAVTARPLAEAVAAGEFRGDLFQHIGTVSITLPPLRERGADVQLLAERFLEECGAPAPPRLEPAALALLRSYRWPGNVRELRQVVERAVLLANGSVVRAADLPLAPVAPAQAPQRTDDLPLSLAEMERRHIEAVLRRVGWHQGRAAELLGISPKTLYRKIREYGFRRPSDPPTSGISEPAA